MRQFCHPYQAASRGDDILRRRDLLAGLAMAPFLLGSLCADGADQPPAPDRPAAARARPGDPAWPSAAQWEELNRRTGGRLIKLRSPLEDCVGAPAGPACRDLFGELKNPYYIGDEVGLAQTTGWLDAWTCEAPD